MPSIQTFQDNTLLGEIIGAIREDGVVIVKDFLPAVTIQEMNDLLQPYNDAGNPDEGHSIPNSLDEVIAGDFFIKPRTHSIYGLLGKMPGPVSQVIQHPIWAGIMDAFLSETTAE